MASRLRAHSPCGANVLVSMPNQLTPVRCTTLPSASTMLPPSVRNGPAPSGAKTAASGPEAAGLSLSGGAAAAGQAVVSDPGATEDIGDLPRDGVANRATRAAMTMPAVTIHTTLRKSKPYPPCQEQQHCSLLYRR